MLERSAVKVARSVLRRGRASNRSFLFDCSSAVNNEIEMIPACFLFINALSVCVGGGLGCYLVLPAEAMAVEIYNLCNA